MNKNKKEAPVINQVIKTELFMMLNQLKGARRCADLYMKLPICLDDGRGQMIQQAVEKINDALNDVACVIGWDGLQQVVEDE